MKNTFKILSAVGAASAAAAAATVAVVSDYAINSRSRLFGGRHAGEQPLPQSARAETVKIKNSAQMTLCGHFLHVENAERIILAVHGWRSSWQHDFRDQCALLEQLSCDVLYIDQRAHGESDGKYIGFGINERFDCLDWLRYIEEHNPRGLPVYLFGVSMGATSVMLASELIGKNRVRGIIADCGFTSAGDIWRCFIEQRSKYTGSCLYRLSDLRCLKRAGYRGDSRSTVQALKNTDIPFLFIHGGDDRFVPTEMSVKSFDSCASKKRLVIVPGAKHARSCRVAPELYRAELCSFFEKYDNLLERK